MLTLNASKWLIELPTASFNKFKALEMAFLTHFQLLIWYEIDTDPITSLKKNNSAHISYHIHEWQCCITLIKAPIHDRLLVDRFTYSFYPPISKDGSMARVVIEEKFILHSQHLDLIYS